MSKAKPLLITAVVVLVVLAIVSRVGFLKNIVSPGS